MCGLAERRMRRSETRRMRRVTGTHMCVPVPSRARLGSSIEMPTTRELTGKRYEREQMPIKPELGCS
jgi:hypothetical protein